MCTDCGCGVLSDTKEHLTPARSGRMDSEFTDHNRRVIDVNKNILEKNNAYAKDNRSFLARKHILALNLVSSPGAGKTSLLIKTLANLKNKIPIKVIEGDQHTSNDSKKIMQTGVVAKQINTGKGCHLDAHAVGHAINDLAPEENSILFIENVGNLVCPAEYDLGEQAKVVILSVTEGEDKPLKYPHMFKASSLMIINKTDLLPYVDFDMDQCIAYAKQVNPSIAVISLSVTSGEGFGAWCDWVLTQQAALLR